MWGGLFSPHPSPLSPSPFLPLCLAGTEEAFYRFSFFFSLSLFFLFFLCFFFLKKAPKEPHQHSTCITKLTASNHVSLPYRVHVCVCVGNECVCDGGRQAETVQGESLLLLTVNPQGHVQALVNRFDAGRECEVKWGWYSRSGCGIRIFDSTFRLMAAKAPPVCFCPTRCVLDYWSKEMPHLPSPLAGWVWACFDDVKRRC